MHRLAVTAAKATLLSPILLCLAIAWLLALVVATLASGAGSLATHRDPPASDGADGDPNRR